MSIEETLRTTIASAMAIKGTKLGVVAERREDSEVYDVHAVEHKGQGEVAILGTPWVVTGTNATKKAIVNLRNIHGKPTEGFLVFLINCQDDEAATLQLSEQDGVTWYRREIIEARPSA